MRAVTFDDEEIDFDALLVASVADGYWQALRASISRGLAASASGAVASPAESTAARTAFRRSRGLLAADDLDRWLTVRSVTLAQWRSHVLVMSLAEASPRSGDHGDVDAIRAAAAVAIRVEDFLAPVANTLLMGAASLTGAASTCPEGTADAGAVASLLELVMDEPALPLLDRSMDQLHAHAATVTRLRDQLDRARQQVDENEALAVIQANLVDWTEFDYEEVVLATESSAKEAALCVRLDGSDLESVGDLAGVTVRRHRHTVTTAGPAGSFLVGAVVGDAVGPIESPNGWSVAVLRDRRPPDPDDPAMRSRAREQVLERTLARRLAGRVIWHVIC